VLVEGDITSTERKLWLGMWQRKDGGRKAHGWATKLESDMTRSNFAIGYKFRQSLSCYIANGRRRSLPFISYGNKFTTYLNLSSTCILFRQIASF